MKVALRADASLAIGTGHLRRCLALAQALRAGGATCLFVVRDLGVDATAPLVGAGFEVLWLPQPGAAGMQRAAQPDAHAQWAGVGAEIDAAETAHALRHASCDWVVVDHYAFAAPWHRAVRQALGCRVAAIDDLADRDLDVELLIDHNHAADHRAKYAAHLGAGVPLLGGPAFALLAPAYATAPRHRVVDCVESVGVFFGGVDRQGASRLALAALEQAGFVGPVEVVVTSACPQLDELRSAAAARPGTTLSVDLPDLAAFFARHGLHVGAGGGATWERCCIGAPTLACVVAENQRQVLEPIAALGVLELCADLRAEALATALRPLLADAPRRRRLADTSKRLVDGRGAARVAAAMAATCGRRASAAATT
jgi:UDP-2,4-diacetamido-2,4,6-trideoxy-beta-L-altropyranose hydrolase